MLYPLSYEGWDKKRPGPRLSTQFPASGPPSIWAAFRPRQDRQRPTVAAPREPPPACAEQGVLGLSVTQAVTPLTFVAHYQVIKSSLDKQLRGSRMGH